MLFHRFRKRREANGHEHSTCGNADSQIIEWMKKVQNSAVVEDEVNIQPSTQKA